MIRSIIFRQMSEVDNSHPKKIIFLGWQDVKILTSHRVIVFHIFFLRNSNPLGGCFYVFFCCSHGGGDVWTGSWQVLGKSKVFAKQVVMIRLDRARDMAVSTCPKLVILGGLVGVNLIVTPTRLLCVESDFFFDLLHIFGTKIYMGGIHYFFQAQAHRKTRVWHVESKQLDTWRYAIDIQRFARGHRRAKLSGTLRSRPFWMKRSLENHGYHSMGPRFFFGGRG